MCVCVCGKKTKQKFNKRITFVNSCKTLTKDTDQMQRISVVILDLTYRGPMIQCCYITGGLGVQSPDAAKKFFAILRPKIGFKNMRNAKTNNASLYCNFYPRLKTYFSV